MYWSKYTRETFKYNSHDLRQSSALIFTYIEFTDFNTQDLCTCCITPLSFDNTGKYIAWCLTTNVYCKLKKKKKLF